MTSDDQFRLTFSQRLILAILPRVVWPLFWLLGRTWRFEVILEDGAEPVHYGDISPANIYCFWHQCVLPATFYFRHTKAVILVSRSFDGELTTRVLRMFNIDTVRGSSSRGGREALRGLINVIETGRTPIFTTDGPRGPVYQSKTGPIRLAQATGVPVGSFHLEPERAWVMNSWDHFLVPKPFTRICLSWSRWVNVPAELTTEELELKRQELDANLERARMSAYAHFGRTVR